MKKKISLMIIVICLLISINTLGFPIKLFAEEINVNSGESLQSSINYVLGNSSDIDYIYIGSGTYVEQIIINIPP
ncbi:MAG: hypothetical protein PHU65_05445, partial [Actinomycetota bacterium]|nr:hypothetical protein [Actinomycetota bacterium]